MTDEHGSPISSNSSASVSYLWQVYKVLNKRTSSQNMVTSDAEILLVDGFENFAATGELKKKRINTRKLSNGYTYCRISFKPTKQS